MRFLSHIVLLIFVALLVGFGLSFWSLEKGQLFGTIRSGPWVAWSEVGSPHPDPYTRAYMSRNGALELSRAEGIRFIAKQDSDGKDLLAGCNYRVDGTTPETSFWTLVATNSTGQAVTRLEKPLALRGDQIIRAEDGAFALHIGPTLAPANWLETSSSDEMTFVLTLYDSTVFSGLNSLTNSLPSIFLEAC